MSSEFESIYPHFMRTSHYHWFMVRNIHFYYDSTITEYLF